MSASTWRRFRDQFSRQVDMLQAATTSADGIGAASLPAGQFYTFEGLECRKYSIERKLTELILPALNGVQFEPVRMVQ